MPTENVAMSMNLSRYKKENLYLSGKWTIKAYQNFLLSTAHKANLKIWEKADLCGLRSKVHE